MERKILKLKINIKNIEKLIDVIKDLTKIKDEFVLKINSKTTLIFCFDGKENVVNSIKSFIFNTSELFTTEDEIVPIVIFKQLGKKFASTLENYMNFEKDIDIELSYAEINNINYCEIIKFDNTKLKLKFICDSSHQTNIKITPELLKEKYNIDLANFNFKLNKTDFAQIKKLLAIEEMDILSLKLENNKLTIGQKDWSLDLEDDIKFENSEYTIPNKPFKTVRVDDDSIDFYVFDTYIYIKSDTCDFIISLETSL